jgi:hypothetical protein
LSYILLVACGTCKHVYQVFCGTIAYMMFLIGAFCGCTANIFSFVEYFRSTTTKKYHIGNCTTKNLVYMLTCTTCYQQYVGQTKRQFKIRIGEHLADIRHKRETPVALHFNRELHTVNSVRCEILESLKGDPTSESS